MLTFDQAIECAWLQARYHVLELAALLDRLDAVAEREAKTPGDHPRLLELQKVLPMLTESAQAADRTERILTLYSDPAIGPR